MKILKKADAFIESRQLYCLVIALSLTLSSAAATLCEGRSATEVNFAYQSVALASDQRQKIMEIVDSIRKANFCPFTSANVYGHSDSSEASIGSLANLSDQRTHYVADLLSRLGVPHRYIFLEPKANSQPIFSPPNQRNARVEIEFNGGCSATPVCPYPVDTGGFRLRLK